MSNRHVERMSSILKLIKTERCNCLSEDHLDGLVRISVDGPPLSSWDASAAMHLWWKDKQRRPGGEKHACTCTSETSPQSSTTCTNETQPKESSSETCIDLNDWNLLSYMCVYVCHVFVVHYDLFTSTSRSCCLIKIVLKGHSV